MIKLTELDKDKVMAKKYIVKTNDIVHGAFNDGHNACVSLNDRLELIIDHERIESNIDLKLRQMLVNNEPDKLGITKSMVIAEYLKDNLKQWAKIGIRKE